MYVFSVAYGLYFTDTPLVEHLSNNSADSLGPETFLLDIVLISPILDIVNVHSSLMICRLGSLSNVNPKNKKGYHNHV